MSFFRKLFNNTPIERKVTLKFKTDSRTANFVKPIIAKLLMDNNSGETYRCSVAHWFHSPRPPINTYLGMESLVKIEGPLQSTSFGKYFPIGGLILSPGVTAHLNPIEADKLDEQIKIAIERTIINWVSEHGLYDLPSMSEENDLSKANREAIEIIAQWEAEEICKNPSKLSKFEGGKCDQ